MPAPAARRRPAKKGNHILILAAAGVVVLLLGGVGVGGFVWPGFFKSKPAPFLAPNNPGGPNQPVPPADADVNVGTGSETPVAYLPRESTVLGGLNVGTLLGLDLQVPGVPPLPQAAEAGLQQVPPLLDFQNQAGVKLLDLADRVWVGVAYPDPKVKEIPRAAVVVLKSKVPFDQKKIGAALKAQQQFLSVEQAKANGRTYFKVALKDAPPEIPTGIVYMPSNQLVVVALAPDLDAVTKSDGTTPALPAEALTLLRSAENGAGWLVVSVGEQMRARMQELKAQASGAPPDLVNPVVQSKAAAVWVEVQGGQVKLNAHLACADEASARKLTDTIRGLVAVAQMAKDKLPPNPSLVKLVNEVQANLKIEIAGPTAQLSTQAALATIQDFAKVAPMLVQQGAPSPGPGPGPAPVPPPPKVPVLPPAPVLPPPKDPKVTVVTEDLKGATTSVRDVKVTPFKVRSPLLGCLFWVDARGSAFYGLDPAGVIHRYAFPELKETQRIELDAPCTYLSPSAEGLVVSVPQRHEVWVLDPDKGTIKQRVGVASLERAVSAPGLSTAFATAAGGILCEIDLRSGKVAVYGGEARSFGGYARPVMSPDGKHLFTTGGIEQMYRFSVRDGKARYEQTSPRIAQGRVDVGVQVSVDSKLVTLPTYAGNYGAPYGGVFVYPVENIEQPLVTLAFGGPAGGAVAADPASGKFYGHSGHENQWLVFDPSGKVQGTYDLGTKALKQILVHPAGGQVLLLGTAKVLLVEVPPK